ncbi:MAG: cytochrome P450 [Caulobacterales bacterium]
MSADTAIGGAPHFPVVDLSNPAVWQNLAAVLAGPREEGPIGYTETGVPLVLRHDLMEAALKEPRLGQNDLSFLGHPANGFVNTWYGKTMVTKEGAEHARLRAIVAKAFTARHMEAMRGLIRDVAETNLLPFLHNGPFDATEEFSQYLPVKAVISIFGIPEEELKLFYNLAHDFGLLFSFSAAGNPEIEARLKKAMDGLDSYVSDLIQRRRKNPGDDLLSKLTMAADGEDRLSEEELVMMVGTFLYAGVETTEAMMPILVKLFAQYPDQFDKVRDNPALIPNAVEEAMRFEPNVGVIARVAKESFEFGGMPLERGQIMLNSVIAANHDPRLWDHPELFNVERTKAKTISFGVGVHHCIGANLARIELQETLRVLTRAKRFELQNDPQFEPFSNTRQFDSVHVKAIL